jgi:hypothetical protein
MTASLLALLLACSAEPGPVTPAAPAKARDVIDPLRDARISPEIVVDADGTFRLAHSVLLADETGATDFRQGETLSEKVRARKVFHLDSAKVTRAELFFYGSATKIALNGKPIEKSERLTSTAWTRVPLPVEQLKAGENEIVLWGAGSLLIEPSRRAGRSFKSTDGGRSWSADTLGVEGHLRGEYLVRLRLGRYAPRGSILYPVDDAWDVDWLYRTQPKRVAFLRGETSLQAGQPKGCRVEEFIRTGTTPSPAAETWTDWAPLDDVVAGKDFLRDEIVAAPERKSTTHRWYQLRIDLSTSDPQATPRARESDLIRFTSGGGRESPVELQKGLKVVHRFPVTNSETLRLPSVPFVYQKPSPRLKLLRERYKLDKVIAPGKTDMEQLMLLRYWVRNQWHTAWQGDGSGWMPPWDTLMILESKDNPDCLTMCTHYACVFTQCAIALGFNARHCILDHHCVSEVWVDQHHKWVMMDTGNSAERADVGLHFERGGVPLSARELQEAHRSGKTADLTVCFTPARLVEKIAPLCRPAPKGKSGPRPDTVTGPDLKKYPVCQLDNYRRYAFPPRNNYLATLYPGELEQGYSDYFYDGYCWVGDRRDDPKTSPEYSYLLDPSRPQDIDWPLNEVYPHLCRTATDGEVRVDVETNMPNLDHLEKAAGATWEKMPASFIWKLRPGKNELRVHGVNAWGRIGQEGRVVVEWTPKR